MYYNHPTETSITEMSYIELSVGARHEPAPDSSSFRSPSSNQSTIPTSRSPRRRKSFSPKRRREVAAVRKIGACGNCRSRKIRVRIKSYLLVVRPLTWSSVYTSFIHRSESPRTCSTRRSKSCFLYRPWSRKLDKAMTEIRQDNRPKFSCVKARIWNVK